MAILNNKPSKRALNAQNTKSRLFATAISLFTQYGFEKVTIEDITSVAGLSKGTFYVYFKSKDSILLEEFHMIDQNYESVMAKLPENASGTTQILTLIDAMTDYCANTVGLPFMKVVYANQISPSKESILDDKNRNIYLFSRKAIICGKKNGEFPDIDDDVFSEIIVRHARSILYDWCLYDGKFDLQSEAHSFFTLILSSLNALAKSQNDLNL